LPISRPAKGPPKSPPTAKQAGYTARLHRSPAFLSIGKGYRGGIDELPGELSQMLAALGPRPRKERLRAAILRLTEHAPYTPAELSALLGMRDVAKLVERHLGPMVKSGQLERTHPDNLTHPRQRYRARQASLGVETSAKRPSS